MVTELWRKRECLENLSKEHNSEIKKRGAIILVRDTTSWPDTYSHKVAWRYPERFWVMVCTRMFGGKSTKWLLFGNQERGSNHSCAQRRLDLLHIPVILQEDIPKRSWVMERTIIVYGRTGGREAACHGMSVFFFFFFFFLFSKQAYKM